jgi:hypothetical protein
MDHQHPLVSECNRNWDKFWSGEQFLPQVITKQLLKSYYFNKTFHDLAVVLGMNTLHNMIQCLNEVPAV